MSYEKVLLLSVEFGLAAALLLASIWAWNIAKNERLPAGLKQFVQMASIVLFAIGFAQLISNGYEALSVLHRVWAGTPGP